MPDSKREPNKYAQFVKRMMATPEIKAIPHKERFTQISKLWKKEKTKQES